MPVTFETVRKIALSLDNVKECKSYGTPGFKVGGALFLRFHQDGESLVVRTDTEQRAEMMEADPSTYYLTDHYLNYPWILARLSRINADALRGLVRMAWQEAKASKPRRTRRRTAR